MKKINCQKNCRKTKQIRSSNKCMKVAFLKDDSIIYSCEANIKTPEEISYYNCQFIDNDIKSKCKTCNLPCIVKNKKTKIKSIKDLKKAEKYGFNLLEEGATENKVAKYARKLISDGLSGKGIDVEKFKFIYKIISKK
jgi:hypothetical protein